MPYLKHVGVDTSYSMHVPLENLIIAVWEAIKKTLKGHIEGLLRVAYLDALNSKLLKSF